MLKGGVDVAVDQFFLFNIVLLTHGSSDALPIMAGVSANNIQVISMVFIVSLMPIA
jgi:hypothetical protein